MESWVRLSEGMFLKRNVSETHEFYLTNYVRLWETRLGSKGFGTHLLENNPVLEGNIDTVIKCCMKMLHENLLKNTAIVELKSENNAKEIKLFLRVDSDNFSLKLPFSFFLSEPETFCKEITYPMICLLEELHASEHELKQQISKKDTEIDEYKSNGAILPLKHLQTVKFEPNVHELNFIKTKFMDNNNLTSIIKGLLRHSLFPEEIVNMLVDNVCQKTSQKRKKGSQKMNTNIKTIYQLRNSVTNSSMSFKKKSSPKKNKHINL